MAHILVVDDEPAVRRALERALKLESYEVEMAADGREALDRLAERPADAVILDVMMPGVDGLEVCRRLRAAGDRTPILMLTARDAIDDRVQGLDAGADDYLTKPFDFKELLARLRALARRSVALRPRVIRVADLSLDTGSHQAARAGKPVSLTAKEYALLEFLMLNEGRVVGREQIAEHVWDETFDPFSNVIDVYIRRLRAKLDAGTACPLIHTRRGAGYLLSARADAAADTGGGR